MYIFLDTNIFYDNWHLNNANFTLLANFVNNSGAILLISELVCQEVDNIQDGKNRDAMSALQKAIKVFNHINAKSVEVDFEKLNLAYSLKTLLNLQFNNVRYFGFNDVQQDQVVARAIKKILPFKEADKGYRDTMIWLSLLQELEKLNLEGEVIFISSNSNDFFEKESRNFNEDLKRDIIEHKLHCEFDNYTSLNNFLQTRVVTEDHLVKYDEIQASYLNDIDFEIEREIEEYLNGISSDDFRKMLSDSNSRFPELPTVSSHWFDIVEGIEDPSVVGCKKISDNFFYISYQFNLRMCEINFDIDNYYIIGNPQWMNRYFDLEELPSGVRLTTYKSIGMQVSFNYVISGGMVEGLEIDAFKLRN